MDIVDLTKKFSMLPGAQLSEDALTQSGGSPWKSDVSRLVDLYPNLRRYPDYLQFLSRFGGGGLYNDPPTSDNYILLVIYGFGEFEEAWGVDQDGFFGFAELQARYRPHNQGEDGSNGCVWRVFALDASGGRPSVVYNPILEQGTQPRWATFTSWLEEVVSYRGKLPL